jgi:hypothetical protein
VEEGVWALVGQKATRFDCAAGPTFDEWVGLGRKGKSITKLIDFEGKKV